MTTARATFNEMNDVASSREANTLAESSDIHRSRFVIYSALALPIFLLLLITGAGLSGAVLGAVAFVAAMGLGQVVSHGVTALRLRDRDKGYEEQGFVLDEPTSDDWSDFVDER